MGHAIWQTRAQDYKSNTPGILESLTYRFCVKRDVEPTWKNLIRPTGPVTYMSGVKNM